MTRTCNYDSHSNTYDITQSGSIVCPIIDCGPMQLSSGMIATTNTDTQNTYYGSQYVITCDTLFYMSGMSSSVFNPTYLDCPASGQWTYGNLTCVGEPCTDPGTPPGGYQWPVTDYEVGNYVNFNCSRPGYFPNNPYPLVCLVSTSGTTVSWNATGASVPSCVDMMKPVFTQCPNTTVLVPLMETPAAVGLTYPTVTDNSGATQNSLTITVMPPMFLTTQVMNGSSINVTYTATDFNNNQATCSFVVQTKYPIPPIITCPNSTTAYLTFANTTQIFFVNTVATGYSPYGPVSITYNPPNILTNGSMVGQFVVVTATATDGEGNQASCRFSVAIQAAPCTTWSVKTPANANIASCHAVSSPTGYACSVNCLPGYTTQTGLTTYVARCQTAQSWSPGFMSCIVPVKATYQVQEITNYTVSPSSVAPFVWNNNCSQIYATAFQAVMPNVTVSLATLISSALSAPTNITVSNIQLNTDGMDTVMISYDMNILPVTLLDWQVETAAQLIGILIDTQGSTVIAMTNLYGQGICADIYVPQETSSSTSSFTCPPGQTVSLGANNNVCTACAAGTYAIIATGACMPCPMGTYQNMQGQSACISCPAQMSTYTTGAFSASQCMPDCSSAKMVSGPIPRMAPCFECPINTYAVNSTTCMQCPPGTSTVSTGKYLPSQCLTQCQPGTFSPTGFVPSVTSQCSQCPTGYYQPNSKQTTCIECPNTTDYTVMGATSVTQCQPGYSNLCGTLPCQSGGTCSVANHAYFCTCTPDYTGPTCGVNIDFCESNPCYNGGVCSAPVSAVPTFLCSCINGYTGSRCEVMPNGCSGINCVNGGQCQNLGLSFKCLCPIGYSGTYCQNAQNICVTQPCLNGATCNVLSSKLRQCTCAPGFTGQSCQTNINDCASNPCLFSGKCVDGVNMFTCNCVTGYTGTNCQTRPNPICASTVCGSTGLCIDDYITPEPLCVCNAGYIHTTTGRNMTWWQNIWSVSAPQCMVRNYCASSPCINGGTCSSKALGFSCTCPTGWGGLTCQENLLTCEFQTCYNGGTCSGNPYVCACLPGFGGKNCQNVGNMCQPSPCTAGQTSSCSIQPSGMFQCNCIHGYTGVTCETEINNCLRNPCLHGGNCTNLVGSYSCSCVPGWTGETCESIVDMCDAEPCMNGATCYALFNDYLCQCIPPFFGKNCASVQNLCQDTQPCVGPNSVCIQEVSETTCICEPGYIGVGCQIAIDFCNPQNTICADGSVCTATWENYTCTCPTDYSDQRCAYSPNYCTPSTCTAPGVCVSAYQNAYCDCPIGLTGSACTKPIDLNYDLYFYIGSGNPMAMEAYPFVLGSGALSIGMWLRFDPMSSSGTFFTLYGNMNRAVNTDMRELLSITATQAYVSFGSSSVVLPFFPYQIFNHRWYYMTVTWSSMTSNVEFRINGVRIAFLQNYGFGFTLPSYGFVALGSQYNAVARAGIPGTGFAGWLSQVNVWNRTLMLSEIQTLSLTGANSAQVLNGRVAQWNNYLLGLGVKYSRPSSAGQAVCKDPTMTGYPACTTPVPDRTPPSIVCPSTTIITSSSRVTPVTWSSPNVTGSNMAPSSIYTNGDVFIWGRYGNTYVEPDGKGNIGMCNFDIFVQVAECPDITASINNAPVCSAYSNDFKNCMVECDSNTALPQRYPQFLTCGPEGEFNVWNYFLPFQTPSCGIMNPGTITLQVNVTYVATPQCDTYTSINAFTNNIISRCTNVWDAQWGATPGTTKGFSRGKGCSSVINTIEICVPAGGGDIAGNVMQGRKKRQASQSPFVSVNIVNVPAILYSSSSSYSMLTAYEIVLSDILDMQAFDFGTSTIIPGAFPIQDSITLETILVCSVGQVPINGTCVSCPPGTFYNASTLMCNYCPIGTYQSQSQQTSCVTCGSGTTTALVGMVSSSSCYTICQAGYEISSPDSTGTCEPCDIGFYQNMTGQAFCWPCQADQTTANTASTSSSNCFAVCPSGTQLAITGGCQNCSIGYYRTIGIEDFCTQCPEGWVTPTVRSVSVVACTVRNCTAGSYIDTTQNPYGCVECPVGSYQPMNYQYSCTQCPPLQSTADIGSIPASSCQYNCPMGQQAANPLKPSMCTNCPIGYYKNNTTPGAMCVVCDTNFITAYNGSISDDNCTIANCSAGNYLDVVNDVCVPCADGFYQPNKWQTSCIACPPQTSTGILGATSASQCGVYCSAGYESQNANNGCTPCKIGYYKNMAGQMACTQCPTGWITPTTGSTDISQCTVADCGAGTYLDVIQEMCFPCEYNYYQPAIRQVSCILCPLDSLGQQLVTLWMGTANVSNCVTNCPSGQQYSFSTASCVNCPRGYYRTQNASPYEPVCEECDPTLITPNVGSTVVSQCTLGNCSAGQMTVGTMCQDCPYGQYQPNMWQMSCIQCPAGQTTLQTMSVSASQCLYSCIDGGSPYCLNGGTCTQTNNMAPTCVCTSDWTGTQCETSVAGPPFDWLPIIIGAAVGGAVLLLLLIILLAVLLTRRRRKEKKKQQLILLAPTPVAPAGGMLLPNVTTDRLSRPNPSLQAFNTSKSNTSSYAFYNEDDDTPVITGQTANVLQLRPAKSQEYINKTFVEDNFDNGQEFKSQSINFN